MEVIRIKPKHFPGPVAPFSYGIKVRGGNFLFIPNQIPTDSRGHIVGKGDIVRQATQVYENLKAILSEVNRTFENIVKITWYLTTRENWKPVVEVRNKYFKDTWPAATFVLVDQLSREDVLIELNAIAIIE
jgi:reactive intermediate/imine deaminase